MRSYSFAYFGDTLKIKRDVTEKQRNGKMDKAVHKVWTKMVIHI